MERPMKANDRLNNQENSSSIGHIKKYVLALIFLRRIYLRCMLPFVLLYVMPALLGCVFLPAWNIHEAAGRGETGKVVDFLNQGADVNSKSYGVAPLVYALKKRHIETAKVLIERGADVNFVDNTYRTPPIVYAAMYRDKALTKILIDKGANVNAKTGSGYNVKPGFTALIEAAYHGDVEIGRLLLEHGADPHAETNGGTTAMSNARNRGHKKFMALLIQHGVVSEEEAPVTVKKGTQAPSAPPSLVWTTDEVAFSTAQKKGTMAAYEAFLKEYPEGKFAAVARQRMKNMPLLQACLDRDHSKVEQMLGAGKNLTDSDMAAMALFVILQRQTQQQIKISEFKFQGASGISPEERRVSIEAFILLLKAGANPDTMRIKGYEKPGRRDLGGGFVLESTGNPGKIVPAAEGGLSALEFTKMNALTEFRQALLSRGK